MVSTTLYIKNDIPALLLLGSKKWWDKKYLARFGIQTCDLTSKELDGAFNECEEAFKSVKEEILTRLETEENEEKKEILGKFVAMS